MSIILPDTIKFVITDFDGIVTDNCVYIDPNGNMTRKVNFRDVMGFSILKKNGYSIGIISGEKNSAIELIASKFNVEEVHQGIRNKLDVLKQIIEKYGLTQDEYIYIGDDVNDYDCLSYSKYAVTVPEAIDKIKTIPNIQTTGRSCGNGAFREIADAIVHQ